ncbi:MAG: AraC family transcriptional regulator [Oscillospiraceae bacterium]|nr:AraC family transcriptional regulator [Oscillospiraceae bacterium]
MGASPIDRNKVKLLYVSTAKYGGDWHSTLHTHACTEIFYVVGGSGKFNIEGKLLPVTTDDMVIVNPNVEHTEVSYNQRPLEYIVLGVEGLEYSAGEDADERWFMTNLQNAREALLHALREMLREIEFKAVGYELICQDLLEVLILRLMRHAGLQFLPTKTEHRKPGRKPSKECAAVRHYIDNHFKENINLDMLSELVHVNKYYMVHSFTKEYGISPINYLISRRIEESKYLLSDTDHSLSQISHILGFSSPSYFSQSFRRLEDMSPMEFRRSSRSRAGT